jgi:regulator of protease activity HflC (stomatin/prohibitin superfamily)
LFVLSAGLAVFAVPAFLLARSLRHKAGAKHDSQVARENARAALVVGAVLAVGALLTLFFSSFTTVSTKNIGVVTAFGKPTGELSNGAHFKAPWEKVHEMDAAVQPESFTQGQEGADPNHRCIDVRLGNQSIGCAELRFNWQIQPSDAQALYTTYRSFDHLRSTLVLGAARSAVNHAFADYNPIDLLTSGEKYTDVLTQKARAVSDMMRDDIGKQVNVTGVVIPIVLFDDATQANINAYQVQVGKTRVADQAQQTALKQAQANKTLADSLKETGIDVLISKCLDLVEQGKTPPGTCIPLTAGNGSVLVQPGR